LQQVLNAANNSANNHQRTQRPSTADAATQATPAAPPPPEANIIPTPDAQGVVDNYNELYPPKSHEMSYAILKFSDTLEECHKYGLAGRSYTMDERDAAWLEKWNQQARGEGTSTGPTRRSRGKASTETEETPSIAMDEDWFELVMGMFEKFSSEHFPFLHVVSPRYTTSFILLTMFVRIMPILSSHILSPFSLALTPQPSLHALKFPMDFLHQATWLKWLKGPILTGWSVKWTEAVAL
jgi:hypothetical protein